jgi:hypothetical protein
LAKSTRAAMSRASSRVGRFSRRAIDTTQQYVWNLGRSGSARLALETARSIALALATEGPLNLLSLGHVFGFFSLSWKQSLLGTSRFLLLSRTPQSLEAVAGGVTLALVLAPFGAAKSIPRSRRGR